MMNMRKIVQLTTDIQSNVYALCDDGSIWFFKLGAADWKEMNIKTVIEVKNK